MKSDVYLKLDKKLTERLKQLPDFVCDFLFSIQNKQVRTRFEYAKDIGIFLEFLQQQDMFYNKSLINFTHLDIKQLDERDIWNFLSYLTSFKKTFITPTGKNKTQIFTNSDVGKARKISTVHELFKYLLDKELIEKDTSRKVDIVLHAKKSIKDRLDFKDIEKFYSTILEDVNIENERMLKFHQKIKFRDYTIVLIFSYTGIRVSELVQLDINEISIDKRTMIVTRKGGDQEKVPIPKAIMEDIEDYIARRKEMTGLEGEAKNALFVSLHNNRIDPRTVRQMLNKYSERAGIDIKITPHVFRRTFGTRHYNKYRDMYLTAKIMGHTSAETTRKFYADPDEERVASSMEIFDYEDGSANKDLGAEDEMKVVFKHLQELSKSTGIDLATLLRAQ